MHVKGTNSFRTLATLNVGGTRFIYFRLAELESQGWTQAARLPVSIKILLENLLRNEDGRIVTCDHIEALLATAASPSGPVREIPFMPARVLLQDFTGVPAVVDLATMRNAMKRLGGDPDRINPLVRADLVIDHSVQVDAYGTRDALDLNERKEYERNHERYGLLRWAQKAFHNFTVVPPGRGIVHQVNLEYLASVVMMASNPQTASPNGEGMLYPDTVVGTDSHTTMINGLGVLGWGVGGIEAEAVMLGQPYYFPIPQVVGVKLEGELRPGITATDLVLHVTELLRNKKVVGKFVEFYGPGLSALSLPDRATLANMAPEYGATMGFCPVDEKTLDYLRLTGRDASLVNLVEAYTKEQGLFQTADSPEPIFSDTVSLDLSRVEANLAGPKRPQDRVPLAAASSAFKEALGREISQWGFGLSEEDRKKRVTLRLKNEEVELSHGSVVIAAITSCTNTSNPAVMLAAGILAQNALKKGIRTKPWVKTSLAPGSRVVTDYLEKSGLLPALEAQGFFLVGYGCTTCIGNSGPLPEPVQRAIEEGNLVAASVLSGNRNFEGRIHGSVRANYLASPPLVVAYALAGRLTIDFEKEPLGRDEAGNPVFLKDIWPGSEDIARVMNENLRDEFFSSRYKNIYEGDAAWRNLSVPEGGIYAWDTQSTYIREAPFFEKLTQEAAPIEDIVAARVLLLLGDSVTTDHISPAGAIPPDSPAGRYLQSLGIAPEDFNSYGSRRGNHEVMIRGTFANTRIRNRLLENVSGGFTRHFPGGEQMTVWEAARRYAGESVPLIVLAGKEYGTGSSRDWAAKGTALLGVKAVVAESYERIHRSNLIGMGVLPLQFVEGESAESLGLTGSEVFSFKNLEERLASGKEIEVEAAAADGSTRSFTVLSRLDTPIELEYYRHGGILPKVLREMMRSV
ncbi:aconitate hydratase AcnA [Desulforhabdus amnigena]|uniref:Aconitate hydratase n=1 Tax=Desulforhabdus amnigena TaxID=40218 RepID=A0A9W6FX88_9BACT|nr:aconitate hydratase AcnA [Desulforhabdus amnigena]GLI36488.1 aconitate hydratase A [Desulforhabdus amnigena]